MYIRVFSVYHTFDKIAILYWEKRDMKYNDIIQSVKNERIAIAVSTAAQMYLSTGISEAKMTDIADEAQVGVASLYRYFGTKQLFTVKVAAHIWQTTLKEMEPLYTGSRYEAMTGLEQVQTLLNMFHIFMEEHRPFLRFLSEFDMFVIREHLGQEHLTEYEKCSLNILPIMTRAIEKGMADGTVKPGVNPTLFYHTVTDCLLSICQRFAWGNMPHAEDPEQNRQSLQMAIDMFVTYIQAS